MRIIPAIDIIDGKCVRLSKGDYDSIKVYSNHPLDIAKAFENFGIKYLHLVDLDGAKSNHIVNQHILETICKQTSLKVDFGGGLKSELDVRIAFESGANQITGGSMSVKQPEIFEALLAKYGNDKIILGADCFDRKIATSGWQESTELDVVDYIKMYELKGVQYVICTDIAKDGMLQGPSIGLYQEIVAATNVKLIASGGVSDIHDLYRLKEIGCEGAIVGKAFYEGKITLSQLQELC